MAIDLLQVWLTVTPSASSPRSAVRPAVTSGLRASG